MRQILSWPLFIFGGFMIKAIFLNRAGNLFELLFLGLLGLVLFLRPDFFNKKLNDEFIAQFKWLFYFITIVFCLICIGFLIFVLFNLDQPKLPDYSNYAIILYFIAAAVFLLPYELWLFKKYWLT